MHRIDGVVRDYVWGSLTAIPELLGGQPSETPVAELWFGAHAAAPSRLQADGDSSDLAELIAASPDQHLGKDVAARFGRHLPYLLKLIAPAAPLSLQVHPSLERAGWKFDEEEQRGIALTAPDRSYRDRNHKPELVYALTTFEALCGFRAPRRVAELFEGLGLDLTERILAQLRSTPGPEAIQTVFEALLREETRPSADDVAAVASACADRLAAGISPSPRTDAIVVSLQMAHPGDPGVIVAMLLNPVTLQPGEALFVPAGCLHAYLSGLGVELMANSDNVLRAGLTIKHIDIPETLACVDYVAAPPIRIAPETFDDCTRVYYAPVDDFELTVSDVRPERAVMVRGRGPRLILGVSGECVVETSSGEKEALTPGAAVFVGASEGAVRISGEGTIAQADVP